MLLTILLPFSESQNSSNVTGVSNATATTMIATALGFNTTGAAMNVSVANGTDISATSNATAKAATTADTVTKAAGATKKTTPDSGSSVS